MINCIVEALHAVKTLQSRPLWQFFWKIVATEKSYFEAFSVKETLFFLPENPFSTPPIEKEAPN